MRNFLIVFLIFAVVTSSTGDGRQQNSGAEMAIAKRKRVANALDSLSFDVNPFLSRSIRKVKNNVEDQQVPHKTTDAKGQDDKEKKGENHPPLKENSGKKKVDKGRKKIESAGNKERVSTRISAKTKGNGRKDKHRKVNNGFTGKVKKENNREKGDQTSHKKKIQKKNRKKLRKANKKTSRKEGVENFTPIGNRKPKKSGKKKHIKKKKAGDRLKGPSRQSSKRKSKKENPLKKNHQPGHKNSQRASKDINKKKTGDKKGHKNKRKNKQGSSDKKRKLKNSKRKKGQTVKKDGHRQNKSDDGTGKRKGRKKSWPSYDKPGKLRDHLKGSMRKQASDKNTKTSRKGGGAKKMTKPASSLIKYATKISEVCDSSTTFNHNEKIIVYSDNNGQKKKCKSKFKSQPGTKIFMECRQFNLNKKGCSQEKVQLKGKVNGKKKQKKFCGRKKLSNVAMSTNSLSLQYMRKKVSKKQCSGGFLCEVYSYIGVDPQEFESLRSNYQTLQKLQFQMEVTNGNMSLARYYLTSLSQQLDSSSSSGSQKTRSVTSLERLVALLKELITATSERNADTLVQLLSELPALFKDIVDLLNEVAVNPLAYDLTALKSTTSSGLQNVNNWDITFKTQSLDISGELTKIAAQIKNAQGIVPPPLPALPEITTPAPMVIATRTTPATEPGTTPFQATPGPVTTPAIVLSEMTPVSPVPAFPVPASLVPAFQVPAFPVPEFPVPASPVPAFPVPASPAPTSPAPTSPAPTSPAPTSPVPTTMPVPPTTIGGGSVTSTTQGTSVNPGGNGSLCGSLDVADWRSLPCFAACAQKPNDPNCTSVPNGCCTSYLCGAVPRNCTAPDGTVYAIGNKWKSTSSCQICTCYYGTGGAYASCYHQYSTTCRYDGINYNIGDYWTSRVDPCLSCNCVKNGTNPPEAKCVTIKCPEPPQPTCRPITYVNKCCAQGWDCTNDYLITIPKKWVKDEKVPLCVFTTKLGVAINLAFSLKGIPAGVSNSTIQNDAVTSYYTCVDGSVPKETTGSASLTLSGKIGEATVSETLNIWTISIRQTFVQTDKYLYIPGQTVQFRILTIVGVRGLVSYDNISKILIISPTGSHLTQWTDLRNSQGLLQLEFPLAEEVEEGEYKIQVNASGLNIATKIFKVQEYVLPRFAVTVESPSPILISVKEITLKVCAKYTYGQSVKGTAKLSVAPKSYSPYPTLLQLIKKDVDGCWDAVIATKDFLYKFSGIPFLSATAFFSEEGTSVEVNGSTSISLVTNIYKFTELSNEGYHKMGLPYSLKAKVLRQDMTSIAGEVMTACVLKICRNFTLDESGILDILIPPHLLGIDSTTFTVSPAKYVPETGPMGSVYGGSANYYVSIFYSPSNSSLRLMTPSEKLDCSLKNLTVPLLFVANKTNSAMLWMQVMARSQVLWTNAQEYDFVASELPLDNSKLLAPVQEINPQLVRGTLDIVLPITDFLSPTLDVLVWYVRQDGEVVSASGKVNVRQCVSNPASMTWATKQTPPAPKDTATLTVSSAPNSVCGLGVVDRSVEILSRGQSNRLTAEVLYGTVNMAKVSSSENSQINENKHCYGTYGGYQYGMTPFYYYSGKYVDGIQAFNDAGMLVITDLTLETRPCPYYNSNTYIPSYGGGLGPGGAKPPAGAPGPGGPTPAAVLTPAAPTAPAGSGDTGSEVKTEDEPRVYFPETWLWKLIVLNETGESSEAVELPDTITEWVGEAVCAHPEKGLGLSMQSTITTFTPFFLDLTLPPVTRRGENIPVLVSIFNYLDQKLPVSITLQESVNYTASTYISQACVDVKDKSVVEFLVSPAVVGDVNLTFVATINKTNTQCNGTVSVIKSDTVVRPLKVKYEGVTEEITRSVYICSGDSAQTWNVVTPSGIINGSESIFIGTTANLLVPTLSNLGQLIRMPTGCGEQNMLNFAPNIFILQYLEASGQSTPEIKSKSLDYMTAGFQRELKYRHKDGSFSAFGQSDREGSTMLTAFVLKSFAQAAKYITIDENYLSKSSVWLVSLQNIESGCFALKGMVHNKNLIGGLDGESLVPLTAYVTISLLESGKLNETSPITTATKCITATAKTDPYANALIAYALALASDSRAKAYLDTAYNTLTSGTAVIQKSILVEAAGYTLLAMMKADSSAYLAQTVTLAKLISSQRNGHGGFVSTQDTVVALQALAMFNENYPSTDTDLNLAVTAGTETLSFPLTQQNNLLLQTKYITNSPPYNVTVKSSGKGCALAMLVQRYNIPEMKTNTSFSMSVTPTRQSCNSSTLQICATYLLKSGKSNMAVYEIELQTGYSAVKLDLGKLVQNNSIKRYEDKDGVIFLYIASIQSSQQCISFTVTRDTSVANVLPGTVTLYDYYEPAIRVTQKLQVDSVGS